MTNDGIRQDVVMFGRMLKNNALIKEVDIRVSCIDGSKILYNNFMDTQDAMG